MTDKQPLGHSLFSIGHSNHPIDLFNRLLLGHRVEVLADIRSQPHSKYSPQFDMNSLKVTVPAIGIKYLYLGRELGGRPEASEFYDQDGHVLYDRLAQAPAFLDGLGRLEKGVGKYHVALMCSEEDPVKCHRYLLVGRVLADRGISLLHIRSDGRVQSQQELEELATPVADSLSPRLFSTEEEKPWKSIRSVSPRKRLPSSSAH